MIPCAADTVRRQAISVMKPRNFHIVGYLSFSFHYFIFSFSRFLKTKHYHWISVFLQFPNIWLLLTEITETDFLPFFRTQHGLQYISAMPSLIPLPFTSLSFIIFLHPVTLTLNQPFTLPSFFLATAPYPLLLSHPLSLFIRAPPSPVLKPYLLFLSNSV